MNQLDGNKRLENRYGQGLHAMEGQAITGSSYFHPEMSTSTLAHCVPSAAIAFGRHRVIKPIGQGSLRVSESTCRPRGSSDSGRRKKR